MNFCSSVTNSSHKSALPSLFHCLSPCKRPESIRTTRSPSELISRFPSCTHIEAIAARRSARLLVCSRPGKVKERFLSSAILKKTPQPALLIADACTISPCHDAAVISSSTFKSRVCTDVFWQGTATDKQRVRTYSSVCPGDCLGILKEDSTTRGARWWPCQAILPAWSLFLTAKSLLPRVPSERVVFIFRFFFLHERGTSESLLRGNQTLFLCPDATAVKLTRVVFLLGRYLGSVQRLDGGYLDVWFLLSSNLQDAIPA